VRKWLLILLLFLAVPGYGQNQNGQNNGGGNKTGQGNGNNGNHNGPGNNNGNGGNQGNQRGNHTGGEVELIPGEPVTLAPGQDPKSLIPAAAPNASQLALPSQVVMGELTTVRQILQANIQDAIPPSNEAVSATTAVTAPSIGYAGREIGLWAASHGDFVHEESTRVTSAGLIVAADKRFCDRFVLGVACGYSHSWSTELDSDAAWGGLYAILFKGGWYITQTAIAGGDTFRTTRLGPFGGIARGRSDGWFVSEVTQAGYNLKRGSLTVGAYGLLQYALSSTNGFSESGSIAPVTVHSGTSTSVVSDLGLEASYAWKALTFKLSTAWEHEYADTTSFTRVNLVGIPSSITTVAAPSLGHDSALVAAGINIRVGKRVTVGVGYIGQFGRHNYESSGITANIRIGF